MINEDSFTVEDLLVSYPLLQEAICEEREALDDVHELLVDARAQLDDRREIKEYMQRFLDQA